ncbi:hypothetical protein ES705_17012 [subsurface metagenome]
MSKEVILGKQSILNKVPTTRYQGSKRSILPWIYKHLRRIKFKSVLDGFGGTASVSYLFKLMGKKVIFNDILQSNYLTGVALIENNSIKLDKTDIDFLLNENGFKYKKSIENTFKDIYYLDHENQFLDIIVVNIKMLTEKYQGQILRRKQALAYYLLFQACLCKRPFNLFHRKNLSLRTARVKRSFGNKKTWDTSFKKLFIKFNDEISRKIFSNKLKNRALCKDILKIENTDFDLVYLDPPYARRDEKKPKDYRSLYHFLEGLVDYDNWVNKIDWNTKNRCLIKGRNLWDINSIEKNFDILFKKFKNSIIVVSYGEPGNPSIARIEGILQQYKSKVKIVRKEYKYRLNSKNGHGLYEVLIIGV